MKHRDLMRLAVGLFMIGLGIFMLWSIQTGGIKLG